ncbi:Protein arginine N-methyltransferase 2 [Porphyridium purpureum]|uniref:Protein arginine N-methyltransferase 2 n=1 Tax=Porphyridium purpureum TaxID=35688 RepID=A0A5J4YW32_PORPP|nr:Protein arginine N-methyltransferase 2 [Porphyridium purpureum]|eukprot:POR2416..scf227_4
MGGTAETGEAATAARFIDAAGRGDSELLSELLGREGSDPVHWVDSDTGRNALFVAAENGHVTSVELLLGVLPWNSVDPLTGISAGDVAKNNGHETVFTALVNAGIRTELLLNMMMEDAEPAEDERDGMEEQDDPSISPQAVVNADYLAQKLAFETAASGQEQLVSSERDGVMMGWEKPLMEMHAAVICKNTDSNGERHVLNVGFGLGLVDGFIQSFKPDSHTIIEAHPDVYRHMEQTGWTSKPGVRVLFARWQDVIEQFCDREYTGIFWDTFGEDYREMRNFHDLLPGILRPSVGVYSFFNGLCATSQLFHQVALGVAEIDLKELGMTLQFENVKIRDGVLKEETWAGIKRQYWSLENYSLPICKLP